MAGRNRRKRGRTESQKAWQDGIAESGFPLSLFVLPLNSAQKSPVLAKKVGVILSVAKDL